MNGDDKLTKFTWAGLVVLLAIVLAFFTTGQHVRERGLDYLAPDGAQMARHLAVLEGEAGNPWQYRVLAEHVTEATIQALATLQVPEHITIAFIGLRLIADTAALLLIYVYSRKLGLRPLHGLLAMALLAWGMSYSNYDSDLSLNTYFDLIFYLIAAICIVQRRYYWIIPITLLAALNRETSGLIPFMLLAVAMFALPRDQLRRVMPVVAISGAIFFVVFVILRGRFGEQATFAPYGHSPGLDLLQYNWSRGQTWLQLLATLSIVPVIALLGYKKWPAHLRVFLWVIVPIWFVIHAFAAVMAETRLFLVPQAIVFIPGALWSLDRESSEAALSSKGIKMVRRKRVSSRRHREEEDND